MGLEAVALGERREERGEERRGGRLAALAMALGALAAALGGCASAGGTDQPPPPAGTGTTNTTPAVTAFTGPRSSSPIALSGDDHTLVSVNPDLGTLSIFDVSSDTPVLLRTAFVGSDPRSVAITPDGTKAYVCNSADGTVSVVNVATGTIITTIAVDTEPVACLMAPNGTRVYVANSISNTVAMIDTSLNAVTAVIPIPTTPSTGGLHPRALAMTNNGNTLDSDETLYVTLFFGQLRSGKTGLDEGQDDQREGHVVVIRTSDNTITVPFIPLGIVSNTGFKSNGSVLPNVGTSNGTGGTAAGKPQNPAVTTFVTGCYVNQLAGIAISPTLQRAYVVSTGASPNGPVLNNVNMQGLVSVIDTGANAEVTSANVSTTAFQQAPLNLDQIMGNATNNPTIFLPNPVAIAFHPDGTAAWIVVQTSDVIVKMVTDANGIPSIGVPTSLNGGAVTRVDLASPGGAFLSGTGPRGIVINQRGTRGYVLNYTSRTVSAINLAAASVVGTAQAAPLPGAGTPDATVLLGEQLFYTGRGPSTRMSKQSWGACVGCHPDGRADGVTWMFASGPRQTISLDGMFNHKNTSDQRLLNWSAIVDENQDFENNTRGVSGGQGLIDDDRRVFVAGGLDNASNDLTSLEEFQQFTKSSNTTNTVVQSNPALPPLPGGLHDFATATLPDGRVYIIGGRTGGGSGSLVATANTLEFDPRTNVLSVRHDMITPRYGLGAAAANTSQGPRIYAIGGYSTITGGPPPTDLPVPTVEEYNPLTNAWRAVNSMINPRAFFGCVTASGVNSAFQSDTIFALGGNTDALSNLTVTGDIEKFAPDPVGAGQWTDITGGGGPAITSRMNLGAAAIVRVFDSPRKVEPHILTFGGQDSTPTALTVVEDYDVTTNALVSPMSPLPAARQLFGVGVAAGKIEILGGQDVSGNVTTSILEYDPTLNGSPAGPAGAPSGTYVLKGSLRTARTSFWASSPPPVNNLTPVINSFRSDNQDAIAQWERSNIRPAVAPNRGSTASAVITGKALFGQQGLTGVAGVSCATCHGGDKWTRSSVSFAPPPPTANIKGVEIISTPTQPLGSSSQGQLPGVLLDVGTFLSTRNNEVRPNPGDISDILAAFGADGFNIPSLLSSFATPPYFHNGMAQTLDDVLGGAFDGQGSSALKTVHSVASSTDRANLEAYLESIDETTPTFP